MAKVWGGVNFGNGKTGGLKGQKLEMVFCPITVKKSLAIFPSPAGMSLTKLFLAGNN